MDVAVTVTVAVEEVIDGYVMISAFHHAASCIVEINMP